MRLHGPNDAALGSAALQAMVRSVFSADMLSFSLMHEGAFGVLYDVRLAHKIGRVVVKTQKFTGRAAVEQQQLDELRRRSPVRVPEVHACLAPSPGSPEALVLEYLPGVEGRRLGELDGAARARVACSMIDVLMALHEFQQPNGYGELDGPPFDSWADYYRLRVEAIFAELQSREGTVGTPDSPILQVGERALAVADCILAGRDAPAVFIHGDFCLGNLLFDPETFDVIGLIDPLDAVWGDAERDLVHLAKSNGQRYGLLETYQRRVPPDDGFPLRYWFYMFWTWLSYDASIGLRADAWYRTCAHRLQEELDSASV